MGKLRYIIVGLLIIGIAAFTSWLLSSVGETPLIKTTKQSREPDYFFDEIVATAMNPDGSPTYRLEAKQLEHFPYNSTMTMQKPYIEFFNATAKPWQCWSEQGTLHEKTNIVALKGKVRVHNAAYQDNRSITMLTDELYINTKMKQASTDADVEITSGNDVIYAKGMRVDLIKGHLELLSEVQGKYEAPKP